MTPWFPLDDQPGPARPIDDAKAQLIIARALEAAGPPAPLARPAPARARGLAVAAAVLIVTSGSAWAAWRAGVLPLFAPPAAGPSAPAPEAEPAVDVEALEADAAGSEGPAPEAPPEGSEPRGADRDDAAEPSAGAPDPTRSDTAEARRAELRAERRADLRAERRAARRAERSAEERSERRTGGRGIASAPPGPPARAADWLAEANRWRRLGEWGRAESAYLQAVRSSATPTTRQIAWVAVGELRLESLRRPREAVLAFRAALKHEGPLEAEALWGLARALRASGREDEARPTLRQLIERYPERPEAERARGWLTP